MTTLPETNSEFTPETQKLDLWKTFSFPFRMAFYSDGATIVANCSFQGGFCRSNAGATTWACGAASSGGLEGSDERSWGYLKSRTIIAGQIIATSHDLTPHGRVVGEPCLKWPYFREIQVGEIL